MGLLTLKVKTGRKSKSIPVNRATKFLNAIYNLYYNLARNTISEHKRNLKEFRLEFTKLHFSEAEFQLINPYLQKSIKPNYDPYSIPIRDLMKILNLLEKGVKYSRETFEELKEIIPNGEIRKNVIDNYLYLCPSDLNESIHINYHSDDILHDFKFDDFNFNYREPIRNWRSLNKADLISKKSIIGIVKGIITTTENPYIFVEIEENKLVKCFYSEKSFKEELHISDLRVTEDLIMLDGTYLIMESKKIYDQLISIKRIYKIETEFDFSNEKVKEEWYSISESSLKKIYDEEPDIYSDIDSRGHFK